MAQSLQLDESYKLAFIFDNNSFAPDNIKNIVKLVPELELDMLLLQDYIPARIDPNTFQYERASNAFVFFRTVEGKQKFVALFDELQQRHDWDISSHAIPPYRGNYVNGYLIPHFNEHDGPVVTLGSVERFKHKWEWIIANCTGKVQWSCLFWYFESQADAALFKLQFPK